MDLDSIIQTIKNYEGITRKKPIKEVVNLLNDVDKVSGKTYISFGDDASAIRLGNGKLLLIAADGIWGKLMEADPHWAGYCSVLVNVNDIAAMGGKPIGMVNVLSVKDKKTCQKVMEGIREGVEKFGVPMVGGHIHPDTPYNALDVSITGIVSEDAIITSCNAKPGDKIIIAIDLDGRQHPNFPLNWDTTSHKEPELVKAQIKIMEELASKKLLTAGKDISNPGTLGTLGMLLEASNVGATVQLEKIPRKKNIKWEDWLRLYPGAGFVLTTKPENTKECIELLESVNITSTIAGEIITEKKLYITLNNEKKTLFDFEKDLIMGIEEKTQKY
ncbi:MAG TPA: methanogenesis marker 2 protein [Methanothermobacter sp.]|nr:SelD-related protein [Methanothermobacter sp. MT-2]HHW04883.1 methanogenesis marker 2 protein [Methanothermobacter sp.]HOK73242.1 methanogenesis marker 2 protein [Methanothermobacter sp.]HOL69535.1 methanogenesis marker 2 protein [Methanothermobacter sp.]HPQ05106.1 methanogenesis marker 2 protein [Methanothermobacter sp.]